MNIKKRRVPIVEIDKSLNKYNNIILFQDKVDKVNDRLHTIGLPKVALKKSK